MWLSEQERRSSVAEQHPVRQRPELSREQQLEQLREFLAQLWDQVWWLSLPPADRTRYEQEGHRAPITHFYESADDR